MNLETLSEFEQQATAGGNFAYDAGLAIRFIVISIIRPHPQTFNALFDLAESLARNSTR